MKGEINITTDEFKTIEEATARIEALEGKVRDLEKEIHNRSYLPHTSLIDNSFIKRSFAVLGHYMVASLIIGIPIYVIMIIIAVSLGFFYR
jgi:hypothetical protein